MIQKQIPVLLPCGGRSQAITRHPRSTAPIPDDVKARVWVLRAESMSWRQIASATGISVKSVGRILAKDPAALDALVRAQADERADAWRQVEAGGLKGVLALLQAIDRVLFDANGRLRLPSSPAERFLISKGPSLMRALLHAATAGCKAVHGLDRLESAWTRPGQTAPLEELSAEDVVLMAEELGVVVQLPPGLKALHERRRTEQQAGSASQEGAQAGRGAGPSIQRTSPPGGRVGCDLGYSLSTSR